MITLAISTSTNYGSLALAKDEKILAAKNWNRTNHHSEMLTYNISLLLKRANMKPKDLTLIAVDKGPGSFTGCRMAVNVARTFAYSLKLPILSASSLDLMAEGVRNKYEGHLICALDAHKSLYYMRQYEIKNKTIFPKNDIRAITIDEITVLNSTKVLMLGDLGSKKWARKFHVPQAATLIELAIQNHTQAQPWTKVEPNYIRTSL